jgi:hypothetical protein
MRHLFSILLGVLAACSSQAAIINIPCDYQSISNAILNTVQEGDTILIGPGDCTLSNYLTINRNISFSIQGSGTNLTTLRENAGSAFGIVIYTDSTNVLTISDMNLVCAAGNAVWLQIGGSFVTPGPYHFYNLKMTNIMGRGISFGLNNSFGLLDHSTFIPAPPGNGYLQSIDFQGANGLSGQANSWTNPIPFGTTSVNCVEDCYFFTAPDGSNQGNGFFDSYVGAQVLFRHNICDGYAPIGGHGYDSQPTSIRTWEISNNLFTNANGGSYSTLWRGGSGVVFSNAFWGGSLTTVGSLVYTRSTPALFPGQNTRSGYVQQGQPGQGYVVNFAGFQAQGGVDQCFTNQPKDGEAMYLGSSTPFYFVTNLTEVTNYPTPVSSFGGAVVKIGTSVGQTVTNFYNAVNLTTGTSGTGYTNGSQTYDFIAIGCDPLNLILTNGLDCNTNVFGYPAYNQIGVIGDFQLSGTNFVQHAIKWPAYAWGNTVNGASNNLMVIGAPDSYMTNLVMLGRDYFLGIAPSTNVYSQLVYPHPLQALEYVAPVGNSATIGKIYWNH